MGVDADAHHMSVTGLCQVCEAAPARHQCPQCGQQVCVDHFDEETGLCQACASVARGGESDYR